MSEWGHANHPEVVRPVIEQHLKGYQTMRVEQNFVTFRRRMKKMKIAHISDLHLTGSNFVPEWGENLIDMMTAINPELVLITGDLTDEGYAHEYDVAKKYVDRIEVKNKIVIPGNHDSRNAGHGIFEELFGTRFPSYEEGRLVILGLDTTVPDIDDGHVGRENYDMLKEKFSEKGMMKVLALHHHLVAIPGTGRERNIAVDAGQVLRLCNELGVDFVLSGHKHLPWVWKMERFYLITAGTATSRRLKGKSYPSFNVMEIEGESVTVTETNVSDKSSREILKVENVFD